MAGSVLLGSVEGHQIIQQQMLPLLWEKKIFVHNMPVCEQRGNWPWRNVEDI